MIDQDDKATEKHIKFEEVKEQEVKYLKSLGMDSSGELVGLAFSGGGIRSATVNLGILQGFAKKGILGKFDYLSTVSGGGYVGAFFSALIKRNGLSQVQQELAESTMPRLKRQPNRTEQAIEWLRAYSNYLTPKKGLLSLDTLSFFSHWIANTLINQVFLVVTLILMMMIVIFISHSVVAPAENQTLSLNTSLIQIKTDRLIWLLLLVGTSIAAMYLIKASHGFGKVPRLVLSLARHIQNNLESSWLCLLTLWIVFALWCLQINHVDSLVVKGDTSKEIITPNLTIGLGLPLILIVGSMIITFARPLISALSEPILGLKMFPRTRISSIKSEWWYRLGALNLSFCFFWLFLFIFGLYLPNYLINSENLKGLDLGAIFAWLASFAIAKFGQSKFSSDETSGIVRVLVKFLPYFVMILFFAGAGLISFYLYQSAYISCWIAGLIVFFVLGLLGFDVNVFSLHNFYRNRLTRCYLGASNNNRIIDNFSMFASNDDIPLSQLGKQKPIPIINTALNITDGSELAWQQRKAASFFFTPFYSGYQLPAQKAEVQHGFITTEKYLYPDKFGKGVYKGPFIGSLIAISGAAASPNSGYHTNSGMAFVMTLFNARLGRWCGNPSDADSSSRPGPKFNLMYLLKELLLGTGLKSPYYYLSDGGHFENLGIYELVRRNCKLIVAVDAGQDCKYEFEDLGNAIRKCKVDFGVNIDIDISKICPTSNSTNIDFNVSERHFAIGTIDYEGLGQEKDFGYLVYIKSSLTGDEPTELRNFKLQSSDFPHHSTGDQFFNESQFESYRALGEHISDTLNCNLTSLSENEKKLVVKIKKLIPNLFN